MSSAVHVLLAVTASSLTISNLEPKLDVHGSIVTAHDGTYRRFKRSRKRNLNKLSQAGLMWTRPSLTRSSGPLPHVHLGPVCVRAMHFESGSKCVLKLQLTPRIEHIL